MSQINIKNYYSKGLDDIEIKLKTSSSVIVNHACNIFNLSFKKGTSLPENHKVVTTSCNRMERWCLFVEGVQTHP